MNRHTVFRCGTLINRKRPNIYCIEAVIIKPDRFLFLSGMVKLKLHAFRDVESEHIHLISGIHKFQAHLNARHSLVGIILIEECWKIEMRDHRDSPYPNDNLPVEFCLFHVLLDVSPIWGADKNFSHNKIILSHSALMAVGYSSIFPTKQSL